jgi:hypothetical protein
MNLIKRILRKLRYKKNNNNSPNYLIKEWLIPRSPAAKDALFFVAAICVGTTHTGLLLQNK